MIRNSIVGKIFIYFLVFSILIISLIGFSIKFILPNYYYNKQVDLLESSEAYLKLDYQNNRIEDAINQMSEMEKNLGGELYYYDINTGQQNNSIGKGKYRVLNNESEKFKPDGNFTAYTYTNKISLEIYVVGILIEDQYLVYEVEIQSLNKATDTMLDFMMILLVIILIIATLISFILARNISKPIKDLKHLAELMTQKNIEPIMITKGHDEISELNISLNNLYEELKGTIFKLNTELYKEKNAERLKKRFLAQATHELKTPIAVIRGYAEILYDGMYKDEDERDRFLKNIYVETEALNHLIIDVLDYTKMETGNYQLKLKDVSIEPYIVDSFNRYKDFIESHNLQSHCINSIADDFMLKVDKERFEQVYKNLISNAVEHAKSKVVIKFSSFGNKLKLSVYNDGSNINEEDLPNVFESFYKAKGKQSGTGLGLAIVKEIVQLHQGEYRVNNLDDGVEFIIII